ncbi:MAG: hypothetical protein ABJC51_02465 [Acidobacteriota bacterium]
MSDDEAVDVAVLGYLEAHPSAGDTLEGIADWWLERRRVVAAVDTVMSALERLIEQGVIEDFRRDQSTPPVFRRTSRRL